MTPRLTCLSLTLLSAAAFGADASVEDLTWIAGDWIGRQGDSQIEESWAGPLGGSMMGMFRLVTDGAVVFLEFMTIEPSEQGPVLRIKHYNPGLVGWEEKDESVAFQLVELSDGRAVFETRKAGSVERLIYERRGSELLIVLEKPAEDQRTEFRYQSR